MNDTTPSTHDWIPLDVSVGPGTILGAVGTAVGAAGAIVAAAKANDTATIAASVAALFAALGVIAGRVAQSIAQTKARAIVAEARVRGPLTVTSNFAAPVRAEVGVAGQTLDADEPVDISAQGELAASDGDVPEDTDDVPTPADLDAHGDELADGAAGFLAVEPDPDDPHIGTPGPKPTDGSAAR